MRYALKFRVFSEIPNAYVERLQPLVKFVDGTNTRSVRTVAHDTLQALRELNVITVDGLAAPLKWSFTREGAAFVRDLYAVAKTDGNLNSEKVILGYTLPGFLVGLFAVNNDISKRLNEDGIQVLYPDPSHGGISYSKEDVDKLIRGNYSWMSHLVPCIEELAEETAIVADGAEPHKHGSDFSNAVFETARRQKNLPILINFASKSMVVSDDVIDRRIKDLFVAEESEDFDYMLMLAGLSAGIFA